MSVFGVSKSDLLRNQTVDEGWYPCVIGRFGVRASSTDKSPNLEVVFVCKSDELEGKEFIKSYSSKAMGFTQPLVEALINRKLNPDTDTYEFDCPPDRPGICLLRMGGNETLLNGQELQVKVIKTLYNSRIVNQIDGFANKNADLSVPF